MVTPENSLFKFCFYSFFLSLIFFLNACLGLTHKHRINVHIQAARYLNPDVQGEASPVGLTFYELKNNTLFDKVAFFKLQDGSIEALQGTLIDQRSFMIRPEEQLNFKYLLSSDARYLGVVVAYRHLTFSEWKKIVTLNAKTIKRINIVLGSNSFMINTP